MGEFEFDAATRLVPLPSGGFSVDISDQWSGLASVNGGFLLATCLKALDAVLPFPDPVVVSGFYLRPGNPAGGSAHGGHPFWSQHRLWPGVAGAGRQGGPPGDCRVL